MASKESRSRSVAAGKSSLWRGVWENVQVIAIALVISLLVRLLIAEPRYIPSDSMVPTLEIGDRLIVEKVSYYFRDPKRGEIVVFKPPEQLQRQGYELNQAFIKRVIGTEGDTVAVRDGRVYIDGEVLPEDYIAEPPSYQFPPIPVPEDQAIVLGDNRNNSNDSHIWGFLPEENVIGRAVFRFWPLSRFGPISLARSEGGGV